MPLIEAALAFAITMLMLSMIVSSFVELIHRGFKMREAGLQYMLRQLFDQVLVRYVQPLAEKELADNPKLQGKTIQDAYKAVRDSFVERMTANRAPVGLKPDPTLAAVPRRPLPPGAPAAAVPAVPAVPAVLAAPARVTLKQWWSENVTQPLSEDTKPWPQLGNIWGGRRITQLAPTDFMERLGSVAVGEQIKQAVTGGGHNAADAVDAALKDIAQKISSVDIGQEIKKGVLETGKSEAALAAEALAGIAHMVAGVDVGAEIRKAATATGQSAADAVDTVLKDIAQKFDGFGKDAATYFEGRARFMSVIIAIVLAFAVHVDAIDLFKTYLRDPNARAKAIEQSQAVTAQYKAAQEAADALKKVVPDPAAAPPDVKVELEKLKKNWEAATANTNTTVKQYADLGVPIGWTPERRTAANMKPLVWTCKELENEKTAWFPWWKLWRKCKADDPAVDQKDGAAAASDKKADATAKDGKDTQYMNVWAEVPWTLNAWFYLTLGGLLIGLGSPFWYDAVTGLTNIRSIAGGASGAASQPKAAAAPAAPAAPVDKPQPETPVGAFQVANIARGARKK
jgi:hypothetical protein